MDLTFGEFKEMLLRNLRAETDGTYPNEILWDGVCSALDAILPWVPRGVVTTLTASGTSNLLTLPADVYMIDAVYDQTGQMILERYILAPRTRRNLVSGTPTNDPLNWMEYPKGSLYLSRTPTAGAKFDLFYRGTWPKPTDPDDDTYQLPIPDAVRTGLLYYALAHCLLPSSTASAQIRQFNTRLDSGQPVDNVLEQSAKFYRSLFLDEMSRQPKYTGAAG